MTCAKIRKFFKNHREYMIIKKMNKTNQVSFGASINEFTRLEGRNSIGEADVRNSNIGICSFVGSSVLDNCLIGRFSSISSGVLVVSNRHPLHMVSTYPGFYQSICKRFPFANAPFDEFLKTKNGYNCEIGNDVWIGRNVLIKGGITIGDGAIVGMGSIVTKDVPPYAIVAGAPAKIIRFRFSDDIIKELLTIKWWNWDLTIIEEKKDEFQDIENFISKNGNK